MASSVIFVVIYISSLCIGLCHLSWFISLGLGHEMSFSHVTISTAVNLLCCICWIFPSVGILNEWSKYLSKWRSRV